MMTLILAIIEAYVALYIVTIIHELGHDIMTDGKIGGNGKIVAKRWFPLPVLQSNNISNSIGRYGGLIFNFLTALIIMKINPSNPFILIIGGISAVYLFLYLTLGSVIPERKGALTIDDVPNKYALIWVILAVVCFFLFKEYYIKALTIIIGG